MSINTDQNVDMDIDNYNPSELFEILNIENPTKSSITKASDALIKKFKEEGNDDLSEFFVLAKERLLETLPKPNNTNLVNFTNQYNPQNTSGKQISQWWSEEALKQNDKTQDNKTTERNQRIGLFDNNHNVMLRERLGVNQSYPVPVVQGQMNPNLKNTNSQLVNIDSQFRQNSFPVKGTVGSISSIVNTFTSVYSSTEFTVDLTDTLTNVLSLKLYSLSIPYSWYNIDPAYGNNCFKLPSSDSSSDNDTIQLKAGNYFANSDYGNITNIFTALNTQIYKNYQSLSKFFCYDSLTGKSIFVFEKPDSSSNPNYLLWYSPSGSQNKSNVNSITGCDTNCFASTKSNFSLGFLLGFRDSSYDITKITNDFTEDFINTGRINLSDINHFDLSGNSTSISESTGSFSYIMAEGIIDLYGPKYLLLVLDDFNQNHLNKGLVSIQDTPHIASMPSYFNPNLPCLKVPAQQDASSVDGPYNSYPEYGLSIPNQNAADSNIPKQLTNAQIQTINGIIKDRNDTTNLKTQSVTDSDMFALIPIKKTLGTLPGEGLTEFSGPIQVNERIYFGPVDIERLKIRLLTDKGQVLNLNNNDWSFCMIAETLYQY